MANNARTWKLEKSHCQTESHVKGGRSSSSDDPSETGNRCEEEEESTARTCGFDEGQDEHESEDETEDSKSDDASSSQSTNPRENQWQQYCHPSRAVKTLIPCIPNLTGFFEDV